MRGRAVPVTRDRAPLLSGRWVKSEWDGKVKRRMQLFQVIAPPKSNPRRLAVNVNLNETKLKGTEMRCVFTTTLSVDIDSDDDQLRAAFIQFVTENARNMYGPAAMLSKKPPEFGVTLTSREGKQVIPVFPENEVSVEGDDAD